MGLVPYKKGRQAALLGLLLAWRGYSEEMAIWKPRSGLAPDTGSAGSWILDVSASKTEGKKLLFKLPRLYDLVIAGNTD